MAGCKPNPLTVLTHVHHFSSPMRYSGSALCL